MELSILLMEQIAKLFLMIFMGYAVVKLGLLTDEDSKSIIYTCTVSDCTLGNFKCFSGRLHAGKSKWAKTCWYCLLTTFDYFTFDCKSDWEIIEFEWSRNNVYLLFQFRKSDCADCNIYAWWKMGILCLCIYGTSNHFFLDTLQKCTQPRERIQSKKNFFQH